MRGLFRRPKANKPPVVVLRPAAIGGLVRTACTAYERGEIPRVAPPASPKAIGRHGEVIPRKDADKPKEAPRTVRLTGLTAMAGVMWGAGTPKDIQELFPHMKSPSGDMRGLVRRLVNVEANCHLVRQRGKSGEPDMLGLHHIHIVPPGGEAHAGTTRFVLGDQIDIPPLRGPKAEVLEEPKPNKALRLHRMDIGRDGPVVRAHEFLILNMDEKELKRLIATELAKKRQGSGEEPAKKR